MVLEKGDDTTEVLRVFKTQVEGWLVEEHPSDHEFYVGDGSVNICEKCGWIKPSALVARARAKDILDALDGHRVTTEG
ncbi:hypothetical protein CO180_01750 [candidate division WWE3 bacterium CG_4_9_14_3_um_filter_41_6]|nr:MAG: hypothetical protein CO180_01750 [candidate division WWE3 bacterium CG_4_9_14_3_um_filter_41_6]